MLVKLFLPTRFVIRWIVRVHHVAPIVCIITISLAVRIVQVRLVVHRGLVFRTVRVERVRPPIVRIPVWLCHGLISLKSG